jgi:hypothetical protein
MSFNAKVKQVAKATGRPTQQIHRQLYGATGSSPSTRWHDLVDLLLITGQFSLDAAKTTRALQIQQQRRTRLTLPTAITAPGPDWANGYHREARTTSLPPALHNLDAALTALAQCFNPLLDGSLHTGTWNPTTRQWDNPGSDRDNSELIFADEYLKTPVRQGVRSLRRPCRMLARWPRQTPRRPNLPCAGGAWR